MTVERKNFGVGEDRFDHLRRKGGYYVDKTEYIYKMLEGVSRYFFLSRPRRFGKSLLISTMEALFRGEKELFKDLYIEERWDWSQTYPVLKLNFSQILSSDTTDRESCEELFVLMFRRIGRRFGLNLGDGPPGELLSELIEYFYYKNDSEVVVLIDEYDAPLLPFINGGDPSGVLGTLKSIYTTLKANSSFLRFVFMTGITTVAKSSVFSGLNNTKDISFNKEFSCICGYTEREIKKYFKEEFEYKPFDHDLFKRLYNGYSWELEPCSTEVETLYNPQEVVEFFETRAFLPYWIFTAQSNFFYEYATKNPNIMSQLGDSVVPSSSVLHANLDWFTPEAMLFQNGYLTIDTQAQEDLEEMHLKMPNESVYHYFFSGYLDFIYKNKKAGFLYQKLYKSLAEVLLSHDSEQLFSTIHSVLACLSSETIPTQQIAYYESTYSRPLILFFSVLRRYGTVVPEDSSAGGRADLTIYLDNEWFIFEIKVLKEGVPRGSAIQQIRDRDYAAPYRLLNQPIYLVGIEVDPTSRNIKYLDMELDRL